MPTDDAPVAVDPALVEAILAALATAPDGRMSLPRLRKQLDLRMSVLLRSLAWLGEAAIDGRPGPGWIRLAREDERDIAAITEAGRRRLGHNPVFRLDGRSR